MENVHLDSEVKAETYCFTRKIPIDFDLAIVRLTEELKKQEFGIVTEIDVKDILKKRMDVSFRRYSVLGACSPPFALKAITAEPHIGSMLPCSIVVQEVLKDFVEISVVDPVASMMAIKNDNLTPILVEVRDRLKLVLENI